MSRTKFDPAKPNVPGYRFDAESGELVTANGSRHPFLPELPAGSPVHELIVPGELDEDSPDGAAHYLIGGDPAIVDQIAAWYDGAGHAVPDGYKQAGADHHAAVGKAETEAADAELARTTARLAKLQAAPATAPATLEAARVELAKATERKGARRRVVTGPSGALVDATGHQVVAGPSGALIDATGHQVAPHLAVADDPAAVARAAEAQAAFTELGAAHAALAQLEEIGYSPDSPAVTSAEARVAAAIDRKARADQAISDAAVTAPRP